MRLGLLTTLWKRHELERAVIEINTKAAKGVCDLEYICVGSEGKESEKVAEGCVYLEHPNQPLSDKFQAGAQVAMDMNVDALMITGSDDLISRAWFKQAVAKIEEGYHAVLAQDIYLYTPGSAHLYRPGNINTGVGATISRSLMRGRKQLWEPGRTRVIDYSFYQRTLQWANPWHVVDDVEKCPMIDIKMGTSMWSIEEMETKVVLTPTPAGKIFSQYFKGARKKIDNLNT